MNNVAEKIRLKREELGFSQEFVAAELGITQPTYAQIEAGKSKLSLERAIMLTEILQISLPDLLDKNSADIVIQHNEFKEESKIIQHYHAQSTALYETIIKGLKEEIHFLREQLAQTMGKKK